MVRIQFSSGHEEEYPDADPQATVITENRIDLYNKRPGLQGCRCVATIAKGDRDTVVIKNVEDREISDVELCNLVLRRARGLPSWKLAEIKRELRAFDSSRKIWKTGRA